ncbi:kinesin-like protein [Trifolium medium]|uniref:Kinesin-like protein n=1 Tax=Trifolium medium TaxID=97028 RepID=A0A392M3L4_9FABA|nr:kinesin-like protein [Trifolium medium]
MLVDKGGLWFRVLAARYGVEKWCVRAGGRSGSSWWREIVRIRDGVDDLGGGWFGESILKKVGDGSEAFFWTDTWLDGSPLCVRFRGLFDLALWAWEEEMLGECQALLHDFFLQAQSPDLWQWRPDPARGYSVRGAYQLLIFHPSDPLDAVEDLIWHKQVPLKVSIFAWRLLRDRLPTKINLAIRGIITPEAQSCVAGCGGMESAQHLFLSCSIFCSLWSSVRSWIGLTSVDPHSLADHFLQFTYSSGGLRVRRSFLQLIWLLCVWVIWNERNQRLFWNSEQSLPQLLDKVKLYSYWWLKSTNSNIVSNYHSWWSSTLICLGMV